MERSHFGTGYRKLLFEAEKKERSMRIRKVAGLA
jgi:hypothetical protein